ELRTFRGHKLPVTALAFSPAGPYLASGTAPGLPVAGVVGEVKVWDERDGREVASFEAENGWIVSVSFGPDGKTVNAVGPEHNAFTWDVATRKRVATWQVPVVQGGSILSPDGRSLAVWPVLGGEVSVYSLETQQRTAALRAGAALFDVAWGPDGRRL